MITVTTIFAIPVLAVFLSLNTVRQYKVFLFFSAFTTFSFINIGGNSILLYQVLFLILFVGFLIRNIIYEKKMIVNLVTWFVPFILYCLISIPFAAFNKDVYILNIDDVWTNISGIKIQQFTQWVYLLIGYLVMWVTYSLIRESAIDADGFFKILEAVYVLVILLGLMQTVMPVELYNKLFRNSLNISDQTRNKTIIRISSTFNEAAMFSLFTTPLCARYIYLMLTDFKLKYAVYTALSLITLYNNYSSSTLIGFGIAAVFTIVFIVRRKGVMHKLTPRKTAIGVCFVLGVMSMGIFALWGKINAIVGTLFSKVSGEGVSGGLRLEAMSYHLKEFTNHPILGVGFGTVRSYDMLSSWLVEIGSVGVLLYLIPAFIIMKKLFSARTVTSECLFLTLISSNIMLFISVNEMAALLIWMLYGVSYAYIRNEAVQKSIPVKNGSNALRVPEHDITVIT